MEAVRKFRALVAIYLDVIDPRRVGGAAPNRLERQQGGELAGLLPTTGHVDSIHVGSPRKSNRIGVYLKCKPIPLVHDIQSLVSAIYPRRGILLVELYRSRGRKSYAEIQVS